MHQGMFVTERESLSVNPLPFAKTKKVGDLKCGIGWGGSKEGRLNRKWGLVLFYLNLSLANLCRKSSCPTDFQHEVLKIKVSVMPFCALLTTISTVHCIVIHSVFLFLLVLENC